MPAWKKLLQSGAVVNADLSGSAGIVTANIAGDAITSALIADDAVDTEHIADDAIVAAAIDDGAIVAAALGADCVTAAKIGDDVINSEHYAAASIDNEHLADNAVGIAEMAGIARGKIIYGDASGDPALLAVGSANKVLTSDGTDISWVTPTTGDIEGVTAGDGLTGGGTSGTVSLALNIDGLSAIVGEIHQTQDVFLLSDNGTEKKITFNALENEIFGNVSGDATIAGGGAATLAATNTNLTTLANVTTVGALNAGSITSGFGTIDTGSSNITTTGTITAGNLTVSGTTTTISSTSLVVEDKAIVLGTNSAGDNWGGGADDSVDTAIVMGGINTSTPATKEGLKLVCDANGFTYDTSDDRALLKVTHIDHATFATANDADAGVYAHIGVAALLLDTTQGALIYDSAAGRPSDGTVVFAGDDLYVFVA